MPRHAPELECSAEDKASLIAISKSRTEEARAVERARIILARLDGKEIQQVARDLGVSVPTRDQVVQAILALGAERSAGRSAVRQTTHLRRRVS